jgi:hypothetical protein
LASQGECGRESP